WEAVRHGDRLVLSPFSLVLVDQGPLGVEKLRLYERRDWDRASRGASLALVPRLANMSCVRPAASGLCWQATSAVDRHRDALVIATSTSAVVAILAGVALAVAYARERRRTHADRVHMLRTLTHELRTPATSLGIDIEPLRASYDEIPVSCQEPLLRISDGIARLNRVLNLSAKYMALFETNVGRDRLVTKEPVDSAEEMMNELADEWPEGVTLRPESPDGSLYTDREWLAVAVRNLVENAFRHGAPPVTVTWRLASGELVIRVADRGASPAFSLRRAIVPYHRAPKSPGLGLGLAIVHRVARLLDGKLTHEPSPTVFQLRIPVDPGKRPST
ncbi:MAG TPA: HAMP domain-containing sensor histidine kinase, partial [Labilithrix sp.]|nr:HAMP domain-containing sensor histidine kinase [Labilithrix sp.]